MPKRLTRIDLFLIFKYNKKIRDMTKTQKKALAEELRKQLAAADKHWDEKGPDAAAYCYGYLIGTVREVIYQLEN